MTCQIARFSRHSSRRFCSVIRRRFGLLDIAPLFASLLTQDGCIAPEA